MKSFRVFKTVTLSVLFLILSVCAMMFAFNAKTVQATSPVFEMDKGAYVKMVDDGGLRMRVKMDETTKTEIDGAENELFFLLMSQEKFDAANGDFSAVDCTKILADKSLIYYSTKDACYYSNLLIYNIPENLRTEYLCVVAGKTIDGVTTFASYESAMQVCKTFYNCVNASLVDLGMAEILDVYAWLGTENYPVFISTQAQYDGMIELIENEIDLTGKYVEIYAGIERDLAYEAEVFAGVNLIKNEVVVKFMVNGVVYETVQVAKNALVSEPETPDLSNETATYEFIGWDYDFATAVTDDIVINANVKLTYKDITSEFAFSEKTAISAAKANATGVALGKRKIHSAFTSYVGTRNFVDVSAYAGMTLQITMRGDQYYGLAFYSDVHDLTLDGGTSGTETASTVNLVASIVNSDVASGVDSVVEIVIPEDAKYLRTTYTANSSLPFSAVVVETTKFDITSQFVFSNKYVVIASNQAGTIGNTNSNPAFSALGASLDYVDISAYQGKVLEITMFQSAYYGLVFYDANKAVISSYMLNDGGATEQVVELDIPENAKYVRTCYTYNSTSMPFKAIVKEEKSRVDITSQFVFASKAIISAASANATGVPLGKCKVDGALSGFVATIDFVDISEYRGKTLLITMRGSTYYGLAFYSEMHDNTLNNGSVGQDVATTINYVKLVTNTAVASGVESVVEIVIPEDAKYLRTCYSSNPTLPFSAIVLLDK